MLKSFGGWKLVLESGLVLIDMFQCSGKKLIAFNDKSRKSYEFLRENSIFSLW
jgi:hypothetical protein